MLNKRQLVTYFDTYILHVPGVGEDTMYTCISNWGIKCNRASVVTSEPEIVEKVRGRLYANMCLSVSLPP